MAQHRDLDRWAPVGDETPTVHWPSARRGYKRVYRWVALSDVLAVELALLCAYWIRFGVEVPTRDFGLLLAGAPVFVLAAYGLAHLYEAFRFAPAEEFRRIVLAVSAAIGVIMLDSFWLQTNLSRAWVGTSWVLGLLFALISRRFWHVRLGRLRSQGRLAFATVLVGENEEARRLLQLMSSPSFGFRPIGVVATSDVGIDLGMPVLGAIDDLGDVLRASGAECVFVAATAVDPEDMKAIARAVRIADVEVRITATLPEVLASRLTVQPLGGLTALSLQPVRLSGPQIVAKFAFDILLSGCLLIVLSPLLLAIAIAVKMTSPGPILFRQVRIGLRGRPFTMLKFRTMRSGSDRDV
jgi:sugar transferase/CoA-binding protein